MALPHPRVRRAWVRGALLAGILGLALTGCGPHYVLLHPAGPVAQGELHLMVLATIAMAVVIAFVLALLAYVLWHFRDRPGRTAPYRPDWTHSRRLEVLWFVIPAVILTVIAVPMVGQTYALAKLPPKSDPLVVDVTSLDWKWLFQYPQQGVATVNYLVIPTGRPVLFELTANSPMNTFWIPELGGMEYTMSGRVLPLWLEASRPGVYWGHSGQFSGVDFEQMFFTVRAVGPSQFQSWVATVRRTAPAMTEADFRQLLNPGTVGTLTYASYPANTFPAVTHGFTLNGGMYMVMGNQPKDNASQPMGSGAASPSRTSREAMHTMPGMSGR
ncbi:MAG: cytochrome c oxidase subunit II [Firmicutes bacterium]|nr:cytochrome c oxidase subunit II [Alicyclobacillaceae bacterium]MCL6497702.1 cytochrome c oxidase subunit II [Bacillota bacterium]